MGGGKERDEALDTPASVEDTLRDFLRAFANLDWNTFRAYFDDEATVFFPRGDHPARAVGRGQIEQVFLLEFEETRAGALGPPYLDLRPRDLLIQETGDIAVVSFHLVLPGALRRRTFVLRKRGGDWTILHLHASNMPDAVTE
ncbi:MAG TPA: nuclear transport factor 2 family protein [Ktedonobacterales bacterium]|jgi:ketosteroid isomerase-like protein|nr:nuclear transport factor 2 family protein [Ktedonobacterales bacterium]